MKNILPGYAGENVFPAVHPAAHVSVPDRRQPFGLQAVCLAGGVSELL